MASAATEREAAKAARHAKKAADAAARARAADDVDDGTPDDQLTADIASLFDSLPTEGDLRLYRKANNGKLEFCEAFAEPADFSEELVAQKWGQGAYRLFARRPDPDTGKLRFFKGGSRVFHVAKRPDGALTPVAAESKKLEDSMAAQFTAMMLGQLQMVQQMMLQSQESHRAMLAAMLQKPNDGSLELLKVILPLLVSQKSDPFDVAVKMAELLKPAGPTASMTDQLAALEKMMDVAAKLGGKDTDDGPAWLSALKTAAPLIQQALATPRPQPALGPGAPRPPAANPGPAAPGPRELAPVQTPSGPAPEPPAPAPSADPAGAEPEPAHPLLALLDYAVPSLIRAADRDGEVELYADWLLDQVGDEHLEALDGFLAEATALDQLGLRYPAMTAFRPWFERLVVDLRSKITAEGDDDGQGESAASSEPDADGDGGDR